MQAISHDRRDGARVTLRFAVLLLFCGFHQALAQGEIPNRPNRVYDQFPTGDNPSLLPGMSVVDVASSFLPLGQVVVPQQHSLGFVELILSYRRADAWPGDSQTVMVGVHSETSLEGPRVGSSEPLTFVRSGASRGPGFVEFPFPTPIPLTPGMPYTLEISYLAGDGILALGMIPGGGRDTYPPRLDVCGGSSSAWRIFRC